MVFCRRAELDEYGGKLKGLLKGFIRIEATG